VPFLLSLPSEHPQIGTIFEFQSKTTVFEGLLSTSSCVGGGGANVPALSRHGIYATFALLLCSALAALCLTLLG
jgi:hypothetical protein